MDFHVSNDQLWNDPRTLEYYNQLTVDQPFTIQYCHPIKGKGMFSHQFIKCGTVILKEKALVSMQCSMNKKAALVCSECHHFLGSDSIQLKHILQRDLTLDEQTILLKTDQNDAYRNEL